MFSFETFQQLLEFYGASTYLDVRARVLGGFGVFSFENTLYTFLDLREGRSGFGVLRGFQF